MQHLLVNGRRPVDRLNPLALIYVVDGILFASWVVQIPAIKEQVGASETALGFALLCMTASLTVTMYAGGHLCERLGTRTVIVASFPVWAAVIVLPALPRTPVQLGAVLLLLGAAYGGLAVALNAAAVEIEKASGRAVMSPLHGLWSVGGLAGAVIGGLLASRLSTLGHLGLIAIAGLAFAVLVGPWLLREAPAAGARRAFAPVAPVVAPPEQAAPGRAAGAARTAVMLFGIVALCTAYGEGAVGNWVALHLRDDLGTTAGVAAYGFGVYSVAIAVGRLGGGWLVMRVGETAVLTGGGVLATVGVLATAWTNDLAVAFGGLLAVGLGLANLFPVAMARAGAVGGPRGVGLASTIGTTGMLAGPPVIGFLAGQLGLPTALSTVAVVATVAAVLGLVVRVYAPPSRRGDHDDDCDGYRGRDHGRDHEVVSGHGTQTPS